MTNDVFIKLKLPEENISYNTKQDYLPLHILLTLSGMSFYIKTKCRSYLDTL